MSERLNPAYWALRVGLGAGAFLAGLDKFFHVLAEWDMYLSPLVERLLPISPDVFLQAVGVVEMVVGAAILAGGARIFGYVAAAWLAGIAVNLLSTGAFFDVAVRDLEMALAAFALARLAEVRSEGHLRHTAFAAGAADAGYATIARGRGSKARASISSADLTE
jgi:uncharacterized membrane protein YphA (DoxX/SURF4 family)